jgi:hypothetical protein
VYFFVATSSGHVPGRCPVRFQSLPGSAGEVVSLPISTAFVGPMLGRGARRPSCPGGSVIMPEVLSWEQWRARSSRGREISVLVFIMAVAMLWLPEKLTPHACKALSWPCSSGSSPANRGSLSALEHDTVCYMKGFLRPVPPYLVPFLCPGPAAVGNSLQQLVVSLSRALALGIRCVIPKHMSFGCHTKAPKNMSFG